MKPSQVYVSQSIPLSLELDARALSTNSRTRAMCCTTCREPLNLHQPDEENPSQLLATCDCCSQWFLLVECEPEWAGMLMIELPCAEKIRAMLPVQVAAH